jgi:hypothetical protein
VDPSRFDEGLEIRRYLESGVVARAREWRDGFERAEVFVAGDRAPGLEGTRAVVLAEDWSWECAIVLPPILRLLDAVRIDARVFPRDEHLDVALWIDRGNPLWIPRLALLAEGWSIAERWGPRSAGAEAVFREREVRRPASERVWRLSEWYARDAGRSGVSEVRALLAMMASGGRRGRERT